MRVHSLLPLAACLLSGQSVATQSFDPLTALSALGVNVTYPPHPAFTAQVNAAPTSSSSGKSSLGCSFSCSTLSILYKNSVSLRGSSSYHLLKASYWSDQQADVTPYCVFQPTDSTQVSVALLLSRLTQCPFAVKSGGHAAFAGASNIQGGITINFAKMKAITLSSDRKVVSIEPGNTWYDVYTNLETQGLTVVGGRVAAIGVGGLTLGGGISFFSGLHGWACDNVANFEVVTSTGAILSASPTINPDLYLALRGTGNNFGIVTRFDLATYSQGPMWGGALLYNISHSTEVLNAYVNYGLQSATDPNAALIVSYVYAFGQFLANVDLEYALPAPNPPIFSAFKAIPALSDTTAVQSLSDITLAFNASNPSGLRETYWTATYALNATLAAFIVSTFQSEIEPVKNAASIIPAAVLQVITVPTLRQMSKNGGNPLGLSPADGPLILLNLAFMWQDAADDTAILKANANIIAKTVAQAKAWGLDNEYVYMNYASQFQRVVPSYGAANVARLAKIAQKYDPDGVFQTLQPGYFKLHGAPEPDGP